MKTFFTKASVLLLGLYFWAACTMDHHIPRQLPVVDTRELGVVGQLDQAQYTFNAHVISKGTVPHAEVGIVFAAKQPGAVPDIDTHSRIVALLDDTADDISDNPVTVPATIIGEGIQNGQTREFLYRTYAIVKGGDVVYGDVLEGELSYHVRPGISMPPSFVWNSDGTVTFTVKVDPLGTDKITEYGIVYKTSPLDFLDQSIYHDGATPYVAFSAPVQPGANTHTVANPFQAVPADHKIHFDIYIKWAGAGTYGARGVQSSRP